MQNLPKLRSDLISHEHVDSDNNQIIVIKDPISENTSASPITNINS